MCGDGAQRKPPATPAHRRHHARTRGARLLEAESSARNAMSEALADCERAFAFYGQVQTRAQDETVRQAELCS